MGLDPNNIIFSFEKSKLKGRDYMGHGSHVDYLLGYLEHINAETCVVERDYIDKDFTIDYQKFYCRFFKEPDRNTIRLHFFGNSYEPEHFMQLLDTIDPGRVAINKINENYLGFIVVRPIEDELGHWLIGRTMLRTYPATKDDKTRYFITREDKVSLFGIPLKIESLPFQAQDRGVSACATIALWTAVHTLTKTFGITPHSPAEITEMATSLPSFHRRFPTTGLTKEQIINYVKLLGLDVEIIKPTKSEVIPIIIKAFIKARLPIIASLNMHKKARTGASGAGEGVPLVETELDEKTALERKDVVEERHAVIITGYQSDSNGTITKLYVHDDQVGPYCKVSPNGDFFSWEYEWSRKYDVKLEDLKIPIYPKIRTTFPRIFAEYENAEKKNKKRISEEIGKKLDLHYSRIGKVADEVEKQQTISKMLSAYVMELYLTSVNEYKDELLDMNAVDKKELLMESLPRFLWIIRLNENGVPKSDSIYDTTTVYAKKIRNVKYISNRPTGPAS